jgi:translation initiation factor 4A
MDKVKGKVDCRGCVNPTHFRMSTSFVVETSNEKEFPAHNSFDDMGLPELLLRGVYSFGFEKPSAIQSVAIKPLVAGRDVLGQAQSGTGKTGTFGIGLLSRVDPTLRATQALVMAHTHELADQIAKVIRGLSTYMKINVVLAVGGVPRHSNAREIRSGAHVVVGTPGRIYDLASSGDLSFRDLRMFVLDEADEMLRDRFADQVSEIVKLGLPTTTVIGLFSATMPDEVRELANEILKNPVRVTLKTADVKLDGIKQYVVNLQEDSWKLEAFCDIFEALPIASSICFVNTKERAERLYTVLTERGFPVSVIYGEPMTQAVRKQRMEEFRNGATRVLIATNLLARGIDVQQVSVVFNFDMPSFEDKENYIHRIGRCGRFGRKGTAISLLTPAEKDVLDQIASHYSFAPLALPQDLKGVVDS